MPPSRPASARLRVAVVFGLLVLWQVWRLVLTPHGLASTWTRSGDLGQVAAGGLGVSQVMVMGADGLDGIWVRASAAPSTGPSISGRLVITLDHLVDDRVVPLERRTVDAATLATGRPVRLPLTPVQSSRGERYRLTLRHLRADSNGVALRLHAHHHDVHPGRFDVDGVEQWGDLLFETSSRRATLPYWKHEVLAAWPAWVRSWWTVAAVLVLFNMLLARACAVAVGMTGALPNTVPGEVADTSGELAARGEGRVVGPHRAFRLAVAGIVVVGLAVAMWPVADLRLIRLADHMGAAHIASSHASLHDGLAVAPVAIFGRVYQTIVALPTSRLAWTVDVPKGALLRGHVAMRPDVWEKDSDGANLTVTVIGADGGRTEVARYTLVPFIVTQHRALHPFRVSLDPWAGTTVTLVFETDPERWGNAVHDVPLWVEPHIEWPRGRAWGDARVHVR